MNIFVFFLIVCLMFVLITVISCIALNIKSKKQPLPFSVIGNDVKYFDRIDECDYED